MAAESQSGPLYTDAVRISPLGREALVMSGADRVRFLNGIVTGNVASTPVGGGVRALLLTPKAHVVSEMRVFVRSDSLLLVVEAGQGTVTADALSRYAVMDDVAIASPSDFELLGVLGPQAAARLTAAGLVSADLADQPSWSHADARWDAGPLWLARVQQLGVGGFWVGGPAADVKRLDARLASAGVPNLTAEAAEVARVTALEPAWGHEITDEFFPMEIGLGDAIDYAKGCFLGQEPIVRIRDRGHLNYRLVQLDVADGPAPVPGDRLETDAKPKAGKVTSVARAADGRLLALAVAHMSVPAATSVRLLTANGKGEATVR
jgi:folate-binding protein YgfZ